MTGVDQYREGRGNRVVCLSGITAGLGVQEGPGILLKRTQGV